jgi:hypothetical protein
MNNLTFWRPWRDRLHGNPGTMEILAAMQGVRHGQKKIQVI